MKIYGIHNIPPEQKESEHHHVPRLLMAIRASQFSINRVLAGLLGLSHDKEIYICFIELPGNKWGVTTTTDKEVGFRIYWYQGYNRARIFSTGMVRKLSEVYGIDQKVNSHQLVLEDKPLKKNGYQIFMITKAYAISPRGRKPYMVF